MYQYKRLMVALDFTAMDKTLINYTASLARSIKPEKIYFVNAQTKLDEPEEFYQDFPELKTPVDERLEDKLQAHVAETFTDHAQFDIDFQILYGAPFEQLLEWSHIKKIDLLIVGRKKDLKGSGVTPQRLARKVMCSVLFVPQNAQFRLQKVVLPLDFSSHAKLSLEEAIDLADKTPGETELYMVHAFKLPTGYYKTGKSEEEFIGIVKDNAIKKYNKFIEDFDFQEIELNPEFKYDEDDSPAELVNEAAHQHQADLIIIGARGRTAATSIFLGSVAEKLIALDSDIALLIVKDKKKTFNFLELLKKI